MNILTTHVTPLASAQALHSGSTALPVLAELSAQTTRVESPPAAAEVDSLSFGVPVGLDESSLPHAVSTSASTPSATPARILWLPVLSMGILRSLRPST